MEGMIYGLIGSLLLSVFTFMIGRFSIKSKQELKVEDMKRKQEEANNEMKREQEETKKDVSELKNAMSIILQCLLAQMIALKHGKVNGECDKALEQLNNYLCKK